MWNMWIEKVKILLKKSSPWIIFLDNKIWKFKNNYVKINVD